MIKSPSTAEPIASPKLENATLKVSALSTGLSHTYRKPAAKAPCREALPTASVSVGRVAVFPRTAHEVPKAASSRAAAAASNGGAPKSANSVPAAAGMMMLKAWSAAASRAMSLAIDVRSSASAGAAAACDVSLKTLQKPRSVAKTSPSATLSAPAALRINRHPMSATLAPRPSRRTCNGPSRSTKYPAGSVAATNASVPRALSRPMSKASAANVEMKSSSTVKSPRFLPAASAAFERSNIRCDLCRSGMRTLLWLLKLTSQGAIFAPHASRSISSKFQVDRFGGKHSATGAESGARSSETTKSNG